MVDRHPIICADAGDALAIVDDAGTRLSYSELIARAGEWRDHLSGPRGLVVVFAHNRAEDVVAMLGAMMAGHPVALFNPGLPTQAKAALCEQFSAQWCIEDGKAAAMHEPRDDLHPSLFLLLSTSGSTGSAKLVRLSRSAVVSNAQAIAVAMALASDDVASGHLPLHYSYGLSILTSHLICGAAVRLTEKDFIHREFWTSVAEDKITHLPGVPYHYQMMERLRYERLNLPNLRILSQAGGALAQPSREKAHAFMDQRSGRFLTMYGQTEASPRMSTLTHEDFTDAPASVGRALKGGQFLIEEGEVVYEGPNVMMGYAETRDDLSKGDELQGRLRTGDLGTIDDEGRLTIIGRSKRIGKVHGLRVNLDELEKKANEIAPAAIIQQGDKLRVFFVNEAGRDGLGDELKAHLARGSTLPLTCWKPIEREALPSTERGKINYAALEAIE